MRLKFVLFGRATLSLESRIHTGPGVITSDTDVMTAICITIDTPGVLYMQTDSENDASLESKRQPPSRSLAAQHRELGTIGAPTICPTDEGCLTLCK